MTDEPLVTVLLATRNGAGFLGEQLASLRGQRHENWRLRVGDDGSDDATLAVLETFSQSALPGQVVIGPGPGRGATANFLDLLARTGPQDGLIAFCDQDDIWLSEKLERAVAQIGHHAGPMLYACRAVIADAQGRGSQLSALPLRELGFAHALAENVLAGNAMVLNAAAAEVLRGALETGDKAVIEAGFHDWWAYQVITAQGGRVIFDAVPGLRYRQHAGNLVGSGQARGRFGHRLRRVLAGDYGRALRRQVMALLSVPGLQAEARVRAEQLLTIRQLWFWQRPGAILRLGVYRQRRAEDLVLKLLLLLGRV